MGIYTTTYIYPNINDKNNFIILSKLDPIIEKSDLQRGYVLKEQLLHYFIKMLNTIEFGPDSRIIEYQTYTGNAIMESVEISNLKIK